MFKLTCNKKLKNPILCTSTPLPFSCPSMADDKETGHLWGKQGGPD
jgi:hypothetical protein